MGVRHHVLVAALVALGALAVPALAHAGSLTQRDGNDVAGRLDLKAARHGHEGGDLVHTIVTWRSFSGRALRGANGVAFALDTNRRWSDDAEWWAHVYWAGGRLRAQLVDSAFTSFTDLEVRRGAANRLQVVIPTDVIGSVGGYRWFAATIDGSAQDFAPNRGGVLHDLTAPSLDFVATRVVSAAAAAGAPFDIAFSVRDRGGAGLAEWRLEWRVPEVTSWSLVRAGNKGGAKSVPFDGEIGVTYEFRVVARDRQRNGSVSGVRTVMPAFTATVEGTSVAWISRRGPGWGSAEVVLDEGAPSDPIVLTAESETLDVTAFEVAGLGAGTHTITIRPLSGDVTVDAIVAS